jgi:hypothetical protein
MTAAGVVILAHQGGWDEMLMVLGPIALIVGLLRLAKKRVAQNQVQNQAATPGAPPPLVQPGAPPTGE